MNTASSIPLEQQVTLDQLGVLVSIVDHGGFTAAARATGRAQGAVSYHIGRLEEQLGLQLFDRTGRRPRLTEAGRAVVRRARDVLRSLDGMQATVASLQQDVEGELVVATDVLFPPSRLATLLVAFEARFPGVSLTLRSGAWREPVEALRRGEADLAIAPPQVGDDTLTIQPCAEVDFVPVAAPHHPLAALPGPIPREEAQRHRRLVITTTEPLPADPTEARHPTWRLTDSAMRRGLVLEGVGWSRLPRFQVEQDLAAGRLVELQLDGWVGLRGTPLAVMYVTARGLRPAAHWVYDHLATPVCE